MVLNINYFWFVQSIQNISDLSPVAAKAAEKYGVDLSAVALQVGGLKEIILDLVNRKHIK